MSGETSWTASHGAGVNKRERGQDGLLRNFITGRPVISSWRTRKCGYCERPCAANYQDEDRKIAPHSYAQPGIMAGH